MAHLLVFALIFSSLSSLTPVKAETRMQVPLIHSRTVSYEPLAQQDPTPTATPTPTPTPTPDPELEQANREIQLANAQKAKAEAEKAAAEAKKAAAEYEKAAVEAKQAADKARLGLGAVTPSPTPASGNITGDQKFIETQLLAEMGARKASREFVTNLCKSTNSTFTGKPINKLIIHSAADRGSVEIYKAILAQLRYFHKEYERLMEDAATAQRLEEKAPPIGQPQREAATLIPLLLPAATQAVKGFAELVNMFRTETEFKDQQVSIDVRMIVTLIADDLLTKSEGPCHVSAIYYPSAYPVGIEENAESGEIMAAYTRVAQDVSRGDVEVAANNEMIAKLTKRVEEIDAAIADLKKKIEEHTKKPAAKPKKGKKKKKPVAEEPSFDLEKARTDLAQAEADKIVIKTKIERLKRTAANIENFKAAIADALQLMTTVESGNNQTVLTGLLRSERLKKILGEVNTYALDLVVKASGTNRIRRNAFFNAKIAHSGGVSIGAQLFNNKDELVFARLEDYYIEFTGSSEIRRRAGFQRLDSTFSR